MKIPNADRAIIDIEKLRDYCLSESHPRGKHKARVFVSALGLTTENAIELQESLLSAVISEDAELSENDEYGQRYILDFVMRYKNKEATIRSTWIGRRGEETPRLTSCYVL